MSDLPAGYSRAFGRCWHKFNLQDHCSRVAEVRGADGLTYCRRHAPGPDVERWDRAAARLRAKIRGAALGGAGR